MTTKFKIGDRVKYTGKQYGGAGPWKGARGTVAAISPDGSDYGVKFDEVFPGAHSLSGFISTNEGWWCFIDEVELVERRKKKSMFNKWSQIHV